MENIFKLHEQIQSLRKQKGITQQELAEHFNVTNQAISKWENGQSYPDISLLPKLALFFGVSIDELLGTSPIYSTESLCLKIKALFDNISKDEIYKTAFTLSALLHEAVCSKGFKEYIPWKSQNRFNVDAYSNWGYSGNSELDGISMMISGITIMGYIPNIKFPNETEIKRIYYLLLKITDSDKLTILYSLYKQANAHVNGWISIEAIAKDTQLLKEKIEKIIDYFVGDNFIEEKNAQEGKVYRISGAFACILPVFIILANRL